MDDVDALLGMQAEAGPGVDTRVMRANLEARLFARVSNPVRIGRFDIVERIGEGGMGTVWLAHDPRLHRRVAIKLLHSVPAAMRGTDAMLREARALARLAHPHVVTVFESGTLDDDVWLAMEYLDGGSLAEWIDAHPVRTRTDAIRTIETFIAAARGLAAAHDAGLVHRDFKPANVLLGADGRLKVADFGLARDVPPRAADRPTEPYATRSNASDERRTLDDVVESAAAGGGTPAYMAPEQFEGRADARSDQFSFCIALWEALHGTRPFTGPAFVVREREPAFRPVPPRSTRAPSWAIRALQRGLAFDPAARWPTMHALAAALDATPRAVRRRRIWALAGGTTIVAAIAWRPWDTEAAPCVRTGDELTGAWDDDVRARVERSFGDRDSVLAAETWTRVDPLLHDYAQRWLAVRDEACEASLVRHERSSAAFDATMACLERRRDALATTTSALAEPGAVERAVEAVQALAPPESCSDPAAHGERVPVDDPELRATIAELQQGIDHANTAFLLGRIDDVRDTTAALAPRVESLGRPELLAHVKFLQFRLAAEEFEADASEALASEALREAARAGDDRLTAAIWRHLVWTMAVVQGEPQRALSLEIAATTALVRAGDDPRMRGDLEQALGSACAEAGEVEKAEQHLEHALALIRAHKGPESPDVATTISALAIVRERAGRNAEALALQEEALRIFDISLGSHHPKTAKERVHYGASLSDLGRYPEAIEPLQRAIADLEAAYGENHDELARALVALGPALARVDRLDDGIAAVERAVAMCERIGDTHGGTYDYALSNLATLYDWAGRTREAIAVSEKAIANLERKGEAKSDFLAGNLANVAVLHAKAGELTAARAGLERSIAITESSLGPDHVNLAHPVGMLARIAVEEGKTEEALALAERAASLAKVGSWPPHIVADMRFLLARCRWDANLRDAETQSLAAAAEDLARESEAVELIDEIAAWRAAHPLSSR